MQRGDPKRTYLRCHGDRRDPVRRRLPGDQLVEFWIGCGALPTETAREFLKRRGILLPAPARERKRRSERKRGRSKSRRAGAKPSPTAPSAKR